MENKKLMVYTCAFCNNSLELPYEEKQKMLVAELMSEFAVCHKNCANYLESMRIHHKEATSKQ